MKTNTLIMHQTTWNYIQKATIKHGYCPKEFGQAQYNGSWTFSGVEVLIDNNLEETIDEPTGYIFPKEKFVFYEPKDVEWCEPLGIGRWGRGVIIGEIYSLAENNVFKWDFSSNKVAIVPTAIEKTEDDFKRRRTKTSYDINVQFGAFKDAGKGLVWPLK